MARGHVLDDGEDHIGDAHGPRSGRAGSFLEELALLCCTAVLDGRAADIDDSICTHNIHSSLRS